MTTNMQYLLSQSQTRLSHYKYNITNTKIFLHSHVLNRTRQLLESILNVSCTINLKEPHCLPFTSHLLPTWSLLYFYFHLFACVRTLITMQSTGRTSRRKRNCSPTISLSLSLSLSFHVLFKIDKRRASRTSGRRFPY